MKKRGLLKHIFVKVIFVLIAFFSLIGNVNAASFAYDAFKWDTFYEENVDYWTDYCESSVSEEKIDKCVDVTLNGKEKYYTKLYKVLAHYEKNKGYKLNDNIIIATTFFYLTPDTFNDLPDEYLKEYETGEAYGNDDSNIIDSAEEEEKYLNGEVDEIKTLTKHMFSYTSYCKNETGDVIESYDLNYTEYLIAKKKTFSSFFGFKKDTYEKKCTDAGGKYDDPTEETKRINYEIYWRYLEESEYFDRKVHLEYFYQDVLDATNKKHMKDLTVPEKEKYAEEIKKARKEIVEELKSELFMYDYEKLGPDSGSFISSGGSGVWWPIGSDETTSEGDILFASGNPVSTHISSFFGLRIHPIKKIEHQHSGIDIDGVQEGVTNVIAVKDGTVVYPDASSPTNCPSSTTLDNCGGGYGNYVVIQHNDGTFSLYAHLYTGSITVKANDSVKQGQVIGKVGSSGNSTGTHLHFEIRQGSNTSSAAVDPMNYLSPDNPRSSGGSSSEFLKMLHWFEGSCNSPRNGNNYIIHDDGVGIPTVGYGVALKHNIDGFKKYNIDVSVNSIGDELPVDIVDKVEMEKTASFRTYVENYLAKAAITLTEYQVDCLVMVAYQWGDLGNFADMYKEHGNTESLRTLTHDADGGHYFSWNPSTGNGRAEATWKLFHEGSYTYNESKC